VRLSLPRPVASTPPPAAAEPYAWWGAYHCAENPSLIVPKQNPWLGWTLNFAHPRAPFALAALGAASAAVLALARRLARK
jgi:hypothetical protein